MPSSIKLSVTFPPKTDLALRLAYLQEPWQELLRDFTFTSEEPVMTLSDIARQIEDYIEDIYKNKIKNAFGPFQVQVYNVLDKNGKDLAFKDQVDQHFKPGDTVGMELATNFSMQQAPAPPPPQITDQMIEQLRKRLRFDLNDRVLCYCGPRWFSGHVVGTAVPDDDDLLPYLVKTDALPGLPGRTISVPSDNDDICMQEVCFDPEKQLELVRCAASIINEARKPKLRFALGDEVACRIRNDSEDGLENWVSGFISEIWPEIGAATWDLGEVSGTFPSFVQYKVALASGKWVYCHRDDHTLIRRVGNKPAKRVKGISKRMEILIEADGSKVRIDHVTERRKRMAEELSDSD